LNQSQHDFFQVQKSPVEAGRSDFIGANGKIARLNDLSCSIFKLVVDQLNLS
jgi:hypothetical protein